MGPSEEDEEGKGLTGVVREADESLHEALDDFEFDAGPREVGVIQSYGRGIAFVHGLFDATYGELIEFADGSTGFVIDLQPDRLGVVVLDRDARLGAGDRVDRRDEVVSVPVGEEIMGRFLDGIGRPLDDGPSPQTDERWDIEYEAASIMDRDPVRRPLQTGIKVVDALIPIGRGQRELIVGDRETGKTVMASDIVVNQDDVRTIYCLVGHRHAAVNELLDKLERNGARENTTVVFASGEDTPGMQYVAPYAAMTMAQWFAEQGDDALVVFDDLTRHAWAYRELSLLLRRPPGRGAYPGDIFYTHSRLLERATQLTEDRGGGSLTAIPIVETKAQDLAAYVPTNLISITDGQIYLSPDIFEKGVRPAVDIGESVSRVGGDAQLPAYQAVVGDLRLAYTQFLELESFARFRTSLDEETREKLQRGRRIREIFKQDAATRVEAFEQIAVILAVVEGLFDDVELEDVREVEEAIIEEIRGETGEMAEEVESGEELSDERREELLEALGEIVAAHLPDSEDSEGDEASGETEEEA